MLRNPCRWMSVVLAGAAIATPVSAQVVDPSRGHELAERLCAVCHNVASTPGAPVAADIPSFFTIANRAGQSRDRLIGAIILPPHPAMPTVSFTTSEMRDVVAYILSLKVNDTAPR